MDILTGRNIVIAIIDSGIYDDHFAIRGKVLKSMNFCKDADSTEDAQGHGTRSAGIAAGEPFTRGQGLKYPGGVAREAKLVICKVCHKKSPNCKAVVDALDYIIQQNKSNHVHIVSMSIGFYAMPQDILNGMEKRIRDLANMGTICVAAAGNDPLEPVQYPAIFENTIAVGAHDKSGTPSRFSKTGDEVCCLALGENVMAPTATECALKDKALVYCHGASAATPAVAGLIALIIQSMNDKKVGSLVTFTEIKRILRAMANKNQVLKPSFFFSHIGHKSSEEFIRGFIRQNT